MERHLRDLEQKFRDGRISRREFSRRAVLIAGGVVAAEFLHETVAPRAAWAASGITLDPTMDPLAQGYSTEGTAQYIPGTRLAINDGSSADRRNFFRVSPEIEAGPVSITTDLQIDPASVTTDGEDTGVHLVLNGGANIGSEIRLACILRSGERRMAFKSADGAFNFGVAVDWSSIVNVTLERRADGQGVATINGATTSIDVSGQPLARRTSPTFEIGCTSIPARASVTFGAIGLPAVVYTATVQPPINANGGSVFNAKRGVVPVKFALAANGVPTCLLPPATIALFRIAGGTLGSINETDFIQASDGGSDFRIDPTTCRYVYNLGANALGPGTYVVEIRIGGVVVGNAQFSLR